MEGDLRIMGTWNSRGLRGSTLEDMINHSNEVYREKKLALIQKIPTPITPITIEKESRHITLAYFDQKSKECRVKTFPLQNIHEHQVRFMEEFEGQGGIAFIILYWTALDEIYYLPFDELLGFWNRMKKGGRKSFTYEEMDRSWKIGKSRDVLVHYLEMIQRDLDRREDTFC